MLGVERNMSSPLRLVKQIVVFDMDGEMVAKQSDRYFYKYQSDLYLGDKVLHTSTKSVRMNEKGLKALKKHAADIMSRPHQIINNQENSEWFDITGDNGSSISYMGNHREEFYQDVIEDNKRRSK